MRYVIAILWGFLVILPAGAQTANCDFDQEIADLMSQISRSNIEQHIKNLAEADGHRSRVSYTPGNEWAAEYIKQTFESFPGLQTAAFDTFPGIGASAPYDTMPLVNVVATLEGEGDPGTYFLIGGHFDATANRDANLDWDNDWATASAPGADDNASGIAATLEIARVLSDPANEFRSPVNIKFVAFGAEERHPAYGNNNHLGSRELAKDAYLAGHEILGVYILDMIGYNNTGNDYFNIVANNSSAVLGQTMLGVNDTYQVGLAANSSPFPAATYSDHEQFWLYRYKAILLIENAPPWQDRVPWYSANPFYHRRSDLAVTVNLQQVEKIARLTLGTVACLSQSVTGLAGDAASSQPPRSFTLLQNYPNPFNGETAIHYQLLFGGEVELAIYDLQGRRVASLVEQHQPAGEYALSWDATNRRGEALTSGLYLLSLRFENQRITRKMLLVR